MHLKKWKKLPLRRYFSSQIKIFKMAVNDNNEVFQNIQI